MSGRDAPSQMRRRWERIGRERETELAKELWQARVSLERLLRGLPRSAAGAATDVATTHSGRAELWPMSCLEDRCLRLRERASSSGDPGLEAIAARADELMRRVDDLRETLLVANVRFVAHVVRQMTGTRIADVDLIQEGTLGLMTALDRFDPERGTRIVTYAYWWIMHYIEPALGNRQRQIRLPETVAREVCKLIRTSKELQSNLGRPPSRAELAASLDVSPSRIDWLIEKARREQPLEAPSQPGTDRGILLRTVPDSSIPDPLTCAIDRQSAEYVESLLRHLRPRARKVIRLRFGLGNERQHTLKEVGQRLRVSRERVRQIEQQALESLKRLLARSRPSSRRKAGRRSRTAAANR